MSLLVAERWRAWCDRDISAKNLNTFRVIFALVWLTHDVLDIVWDGTVIEGNPLHRLEPEKEHSHLLQGLLVGCGVGLLSGRFPFVFCLLAAFLRCYQALTTIPLNDFFYYVLTALLMGIAYFEGDRFSKSPIQVKAWIIEVIRVQLGFIYIATAIMKMNPSWLSGGHLHVRIAYLHKAFDWPYPDLLLRCLDNKACASAQAWTAVFLELLLGLAVMGGRLPRLSLLMAVAIHGFAIATTNVWFFGVSIVAQVAFLAGRDPHSIREKANSTTLELSPHFI